MTQSEPRPGWVIEASLNWRLFNCCGDEDLFPFKCPWCEHALILCYECDTIYADLPDLAGGHGFEEPSCPRCGGPFDKDFMRSPRYRITFEEWETAGLGELLNDVPIAELGEQRVRAAEPLANLLRRGMRSTASARITEYRNLAEAIAPHFAAAAAFRERAYQLALSSHLSDAVDWQSRICDPMNQAYALLGIADAVLR